MRAPRLAAFLTTLLVAANGAATAVTFARPLHVPLPKDFGAVAVVAADFDGDGNVDLAVTGRSQLCVLLGDGRGGFEPCVPAPAGLNPTAMAVADLNGDGRPDVVVANHETDYVTLLLGAGGGRFTSRPLHLHSLPHPHAVAIGDFDRDGRPDIAVDSWGENRVTVLLGKDDWRGPGTPAELGTRPYHTLTAADLDGDGNVDLVAPNWGKGTVSILLGDGHGHFAHAPGSPFPAGPTPFAAAVADVNGDGRLDIVVANYSGHANATADDGLTWIRNDGNRRFTPFPVRLARGDYSSNVATGDVNGDRIADVAFPNTNGASVTVLYGSAEGPRGAEAVATMPAPYAIALADLNRDGRADLVVTSQTSDEILVFLATVPPRADARVAESLSAGITHRVIVRSHPTPLVVHVVEIDLAKAPGTLKVAADQSAADGGMIATTVSQLAVKANFLVAVNASFFEVPAGRYPAAGERVDAVGGLILDGRTIKPKGPGLGLINAGLCIDVRSVRIERGFECRGAAYGLASGPLLLWHSQAADTELADRIFKSLRHPRTAVGVDSSHRKIWLVVADGRQQGVSEGATLDELKELLKKLGAVDALNLDGGGSTTLVARVDGVLRVLNVPVHEHIPGGERPVVTALGMTSGE